MFRLLLSLLLVFSQQMGYAHALSHATAISDGAATLLAEQQASGAADSLSDDALADPHLVGITKLGVAHSCAQCLSVAQCLAIASAQLRAFALLDGVAIFGATAPPLAHACGAASAYHSRAPPALFC